MIKTLARYMNWLHTRWPAGTVERLPQINDDGSTNVAGVYVVGDLTGIPLLKFSADSGARVVQRIAADASFNKLRDEGGPEVLDIAIIGAGVSGMAAALEAKKHELRFEICEASEPFSTIVNFPKGKPIFTYPTDMTPAGDLQFTAEVKEPLVDEILAQTIGRGIKPRTLRIERIRRKGKLLECTAADGSVIVARRVVVAIGRSGNFRKLGVPGEDKDKIYNRLHDPKVFCGKDTLVVGGGDSALETAIALAQCGASVTVSYRKPEFSRAKPDNIEKIEMLQADAMADVAVEHPSSERVTTSSGAFLGKHRKPGSIKLMMASKVKAIDNDAVELTGADGQPARIANDAVFSMIGREAPLDFFRRSGITIRGEWRAKTYVSFAMFMLFCVFLYHWKKDAGIPVYQWFQSHGWFPFNVASLFDSVGGAFSEAANRPTNILYTLKKSMSGGGFYYTLAYCSCVVIFGLRRIKRRKTPYVKVQTLTLMAIQCIPLFILPEIILPWAGRNGWFAEGTTLAPIVDQLFERYDVIGHERAYWRAYGFILAWPLFVWNFFTDKPMWAWLAIGSLQTFVAIPLMIRYWGKGAYCGWICSCGALAETLGDAHRDKMPHGPIWNRVNMVGQAVLAFASSLMIMRILGWIWPGSVFENIFAAGLSGIPVLNYKWFVDLMLAGVLGVGCYFWFSGRVWCRFACPLAALMHIYARFSRFRIWADKKKCISCNVCTSVCHQGIDIMNFANKGLPMEDPECVRCSACVQSCPTGVLEFVQINIATGELAKRDRLGASLVRMAEE